MRSSPLSPSFEASLDFCTHKPRVINWCQCSSAGEMGRFSETHTGTHSFLDAGPSCFFWKGYLFIYFKGKALSLMSSPWVKSAMESFFFFFFLMKKTNLFHSSGGWEVQDEGVWWGPASYTAVFLLCPHRVEGLRELPGAPFSKVINPIHEGPAFQPNHCSKAPPTPSPWGLGF